MNIKDPHKVIGVKGDFYQWKMWWFFQNAWLKKVHMSCMCSFALVAMALA